MATLAVSNLNANYETGQVLFDVSITVGDGEIVSLLGRNGTGKTTLLRSIMGATPPAVEVESIALNGERVDTRSMSDRARMGMSMVPQGRRLWPGLTVDETLQLTIDQSPNPHPKERIFSYFPTLRELLDQQARNMSGGEQQMLAVGRALISNPDVILMDEPAEGLAPYIVRDLEDTIRDINDKEDVAILLVEQRVQTALELCERHYLVDKGSIAAEVNSRRLIDDSALRQRILGV